MKEKNQKPNTHPPTTNTPQNQKYPNNQALNTNRKETKQMGTTRKKNY